MTSRHDGDLAKNVLIDIYDFLSRCMQYPTGLSDTVERPGGIAPEPISRSLHSRLWARIGRRFAKNIAIECACCVASRIPPGGSL